MSYTMYVYILYIQTYRYITENTYGTHYMPFHFFIITSYYHQYTWPSFVHISISLLLYIIVVQSYHAISLSFCVTCKYNIPYHVMDIIEMTLFLYSTNILSYPILSCTCIHILIGNSYPLLIAAHTHSTRQT